MHYMVHTHAHHIILCSKATTHHHPHTPTSKFASPHVKCVDCRLSNEAWPSLVVEQVLMDEAKVDGYYTIHSNILIYYREFGYMYMPCKIDPLKNRNKTHIGYDRQIKGHAQAIRRTDSWHR